jgi:hypothetical protein
LCAKDAEDCDIFTNQNTELATAFPTGHAEIVANLVFPTGEKVQSSGAPRNF